MGEIVDEKIDDQQGPTDEQIRAEDPRVLKNALFLFEKEAGLRLGPGL